MRGIVIAGMLIWGGSLLAAGEVERPNVLMIVIDDLNDWVGALGGHPEAQTPHLDALATRGRLFTNAHCAVPVCSPSRISVFAGLPPTTHGSYELGMAYEQIPRLEEVPTMHRWFKDHGYRTITGGKVLHSGFKGRLASDIDLDLKHRGGGPVPDKPLNWAKPRAWDWGPHRENTIVVLWSDHGFHLGEKQHIAKRTLWEESTRVPLMIAGPGIEPGACSEPVSLIDLYTSLLELCGLAPNPVLEGISLQPQLEDPVAERKRPAITSSFFGNYAIRSRDWRHIRYADGAQELYDHRADPAERVNLAAGPGSASIKAQMTAWLPRDPAPEVKGLARREARRFQPKCNRARETG